MKKILALLVFILLLLPASTLAAEFRSGSLPKDETVSDDLYIAFGTVNVDGDVKGDLIVFGGQVTINGNVDNDLIAAGGNLTIKGNVGDDIRIAGGTVLMRGECFGDLLVAGGNVNITSDAKVHGDLLVTGGKINISGAVEGKTQVNGGEVLLNGKLSGDINTKVGSLKIGDKAYIQGRLTYEANSEAQVNSDAKVLGKVDFKQTPKTKDKYKFSAIFSALFTFWFFLKLLATIILALILVYIFPQKSKKIVELTKTKFWPNLGIGFLVLILTPLVAFVLYLTGVGLLIGLIITLGYIILLILAGVYAGVILGVWTIKCVKKEKEYVVGWPAVLLGVVLLKLICLIPLLGWLFGFVMILLALGSLVNFDYGLFKDLKKKKAV